MSSALVPMLDHALNLARRGWRVFPVHYPMPSGGCSCGREDCTSIGKHPLIMDFPNVATTDEKQIRAWWDAYKFANIGLLCGKKTGIFIIDIDGEDGEARLATLERNYEHKLPPTLTVETGRGRHLYFLYPDFPPEDLREIKGDTRGVQGRLGIKLDIRSNGNFVCAAGSLHYCGKRYAELKGVQLPAPAPTWLIDLVAGKIEHKRDNRIVPQSIPEGQRNSRLVQLAGQHRFFGDTEEEIYAILSVRNRNACKPPLPEGDIRTIASSCSRYDPSRFSVSGHMQTDQLVRRPFSEITPEDVTWRWHHYLPRGSVVILGGNASVGKSTLTYWLASQLSRGLNLPFVEQNGKFEPRNVVFLNAEDDERRAVAPRLRRMDADLTRVHWINAITFEGKVVDIEKHYTQLIEMIKELKPELVVIDPMNAFIGSDTDSHRDSSMRHAVMAPLASIARETDAIVMLVSHLNKSTTQDALHRLIGSIAVGAAPRAVFFVAENPEQTGQFIFTMQKSNYGPRPPSLAYTIDAVPHSGLKEVVAIKWIGQTQESASEIISGGTSEEKGAKTDAKKFLRDLLSSGPKEKSEILKAARTEGHAYRTLRRAGDEIKVRKVQDGRRSYWSLSTNVIEMQSVDDVFDEHLREPGEDA